MYLILYWFGWTLSLLPMRCLYLFGDLLAFCLYHFSLYRKDVVFENLRNSFPERAEPEIRQLARRFYRQFTGQAMEAFKLLHMSEKQILNRMHYRNPEVLTELFQAGRSVITATAHFAAWQWLVSLPLVTNHKVLVVYKPPGNERADWIYRRIQNKYGGISVDFQRLPRKLLECSVRKELTATFLVNDQSPVKEQIRYWTSFLNQDTPMQNGLERLAQKTGQVVLFVEMHRTKRGFYEVTFHKLFDNPANTAPNEITEAYIRKLEQVIRKKPELWLWTHRRWKHKKLIKPE